MTMFRTFLLILIIVCFLIPVQASAIYNPFRDPIVPCGQKEDDPDTLTIESQDCTLCHFFVMAKNIIEFILAIIIFIAPLFILAGGIVILTSTGAPDRVNLGKKIITSAVIGLVIAFGAWAILGTLFNTLVGGPGFPWPWNEFHC